MKIKKRRHPERPERNSFHFSYRIKSLTHIRNLADSLRKGMQAERLTELLQSFADRLTLHTRYEKKAVFPLAEEMVPEETLKRIDHTLNSTFHKIGDRRTPEFWKQEKTFKE